MRDGERLLRAVCEEPDDDALRLVYADWLSENGQEARADLIRTQIAAERLPEYAPARMDLEARAYRLVSEHGAAWRADGASTRVMGPFRRGFQEWGITTPPQWREIGAGVQARHPVRWLHLYGWGTQAADLAGCTGLARLAGLYLVGLPGDEATLAGLLALPELAGLRGCWMEDYQGPRGNEPARVFAAATHLTGLRELSLGRGQVGPRAVAALARARHLRGLRRLALYTPLSDAEEAAIRLAGSGVLENIEELRLGQGLGDNGVTALVGALPASAWRLWLPNSDLGPLGLRALTSRSGLALRALHLNGSRLKAADFRRLLGCEMLSGLRFLDLTYCPRAEGLVPALARSPVMRTLTHLRYDGMPRNASREFDPSDAVAALASAPPGELRELHLPGCRLDDDDARTLAEWPGLAKLTVLGLGINSLRDAGVAALAGSPYLSNLVRLDIGLNPFGDEGARALLDSPHLGRLTTVNLDDEWKRDLRSDLANQLSPRMRKRLAKRFVGGFVDVSLPDPWRC